MSLVGTRPILQDELRQYELHHRARIAIKPGITGMWQVSGRSDITDLKAYQICFHLYMSLCMENAVELKITLHNDGKAMAEEIYVDMDEPENVWVIDEDEWESLSKFSTISDPFHAARQKKAIHPQIICGMRLWHFRAILSRRAKD